MSILKEKKNCWKIAKIKRGAFLVDADQYYTNLYHALREAKQSIYILGWDVDSRIKLVQEKKEKHVPITLGKYLKYLIRKKPKLHVYILAWNFYPVFLFEREFFIRLRWKWRAPKRMHFVLDDEYPIGSSHHQKIVVIDDRIAFSGGLDLTANRWDTPAHKEKNESRKNPSGDLYEPFHDVHMMVEGEAAHFLGKIARRRWVRATGKKLSAPEVQGEEKKFENLDWNIPEANVGIVRTEPKYKNFPEVREVEQLYFDLIKSAKKHLYFENQYFTSTIIKNALKRSLTKKDGPEITIVLPEEPVGWLEQNTMGVLRNLILKDLKKADKHGRLGVYYAAFKNSKTRINIHSKVMIVDDQYARVGSSNLSNRSLGLDTECDLVLDASADTALQRKVLEFKARLLGEHTGVKPEIFLEQFSRKSSLNEFIEQQKNRRILLPFDLEKVEESETPLVDAEWLDFEKPLAADIMLDSFSPHFKVLRSRLFQTKPLQIGITLGILLLIFALWRFTPLKSVFSAPYLQDILGKVEGGRGDVLWVLLIYILTGFLFVPLNILILATATVFPFSEAFAYSLLGSLGNAISGYYLGKLLGKKTVSKFFYRKSSKIAQRLQKKGILPVFLVRLLPIAPYTIMNFIAGAFHVKLRHFMIGTFLGLLPGMVLLIAFQRNLIDLISQPDLLKTGLFLLLVCFLWFLFRQIQKRLASVPIS